MTVSTADRVQDWLMDHVLRPPAIAVVFVLVALLWTFLLQHVIAYPFVFLFFGAIMGSAWFGGMFAGFIAVALSSLLIDYFFIPPFYLDVDCEGIPELLHGFYCLRDCYHGCKFREKASGNCRSDCSR